MESTSIASELLYGGPLDVGTMEAMMGGQSLSGGRGKQCFYVHTYVNAIVFRQINGFVDCCNNRVEGYVQCVVYHNNCFQTN